MRFAKDIASIIAIARISQMMHQNHWGLCAKMCISHCGEYTARFERQNSSNPMLTKQWSSSRMHFTYMYKHVNDEMIIQSRYWFHFDGKKISIFIKMSTFTKSEWHSIAS